MQGLIAEAISLAKLSPCDSQHGCLITSGRKILTKGYNQHCNRLGRISMVTAHSEVVALTTLNRLLAKSSPKKSWWEKFGSLRGSHRC